VRTQERTASDQPEMLVRESRITLERWLFGSRDPQRNRSVLDPFFQYRRDPPFDVVNSLIPAAGFFRNCGQVRLQVVGFGSNLQWRSHLLRSRSLRARPKNCRRQPVVSREPQSKRCQLSSGSSTSAQRGCSATGGVATDGTAACSPPPNAWRISLMIVRRFSTIVFSQAKRPIDGK
jgi:hypothetical protein